MRLVGTLWQDVRYGVRVLYRNLRFTAAAIFALALGIGVNTAVFTAYKAMVARPLEGRDPARLVNVALTRESGVTDFTFSYPDYETYRDGLRAFHGVVAVNGERLTLSNAGAAVSDRDTPPGTLLGRLLTPSSASNAEFAAVYVVSENYFDVIGVTGVRGEVFDARDTPGRAEASPRVLISEDYWQRRFAADPSVLGKAVRLNGAAVTIVGITPKGFVGTGVAAPDFWMPMALEPIVHADDTWLRNREHAFARLFARLAPGATLGQAQTEMTATADRLRAQHDPQSEAAKPVTALVWPGSPFPLPLNRYPGLVLTIALIMIAAAMVLAVACANVASLRLASAGARRQELQTRLSLGASRGRVIRQLLTESALLGLLAGGAGLFLSWALLDAAVTAAAQSLPVGFGSLVFRVTPDFQIFGYTCGLSLLASLLFGLAPAIDGSRFSLSSSLRSGTPARRTRRLQNALVSAQTMLSLVLMIAGAMLVRGAMHSLSRDPGYDAARGIVLSVQFPPAARYSVARQSALMADVKARIAALSGVASVTSAFAPDDNRFRTGAVPLGAAVTPAPTTLNYTFFDSAYFDTVRIPIVLGRALDAAAGSQTAVVSESAARQLWPGESPIGKRVRLGLTDEQIHFGRLPADGLTYDVTGVARDIRGVAFDGSDARRIYLPLSAGRAFGRPIVIRTQLDAASSIRALDPVVAAVDADLITTSTTLQDRLRQTGPFVVSSLSAAVATSLGLLGLLLASMGIYGTVNYVVVRRTREVGIRMAVGAGSADIVMLILGESTRPVIAGLVAGVVVATGAAALLRGSFFGLGSIDVVSLAGVTLLFLVIAMLAAYPPSRRALRVDPVVALRAE